MSEWVDAVALTCRFLLAFVFLTASVPKLLARPAFMRAVRNYALLPSTLVRPVASFLPPLEFICGCALLLGIATTPFAAAAAALLSVFATAVVINLIRGRTIDCGCSGAIAPRQIGWPLVLFDLALAATAAVVARVNPGVLQFGVAGVSARSSSLSSREGLALLLLAGVLFVAQVLLSSWRRLHAAATEMQAR